MKFGAKYDLITVFSAYLYIDNLTLPEYNIVKQSIMCLFLSIMYNHIQRISYRRTSLSIGRFCRAYYHERKHPDRLLPDVLQVTHCDRRRSRATTGIDHKHTTIFTKNFVKECFIFTRKIKFTFSSEICKNRAKISKIFNLIFGVKFQT